LIKLFINILLINNKMNKIFEININDLFFDYATCGYLKELKDLYNKYPDIDISFDQDITFRTACSNGHLEIIKFLTYIKPSINISR